MERIDYSYDPVTLAMPVAEEIMRLIIEKGSLPAADNLRELLKELGLEELYTGKGVAVYRNRYLVTLLFPREALILDVISASGELSDGLEVIVYHDQELDAFVVEIVPANDLEYEGNIGLEPAIIDEKTLELKSSPVFGHFEGGKVGFHLVISEETYERWRESGKLDTCPICGGKLAWRGREAFCPECGYGVKVVEP
ncbi:hypothetical protein [Thermococcus sp.]